MTALAVATFETELAGALELGGRALAFVEQAERPLLASAAFDAEALVLGALQREDTLRARSAARFDRAVARRLTTGTEAQLDGPVLYHALALPSVGALFPDASPRTLLNRNLRAILRGYGAAGVPLRYFGTEVLALLGHPVALVGYERSATGAFLIEVFVGLEAPCVVRPALKREPPSALYPLLRASPRPLPLLQRVSSAVAERHGLAAEDVSVAVAACAPRVAADVPSAASPVSVAIPLGVVEATAAPLAITGDLLASTPALGRFAEAASAAHRDGASLDVALAALQGEPLDGARPPDLLRALSGALSA